MPSNRRAPSKHNQKTQIPRRVLQKYAGPPAPNVCVKADNGSQIENTMTELHEQPKLEQNMAPKSASCNKFAVPRLNTIVRSQHEVITMDQMTINLNPELTPRTKASIAPKVTQKMNFRPSDVLYKNLTSLNVNDSLRELTGSNVARPKKTVKPAVVMPKLSDYLEKVDALVLVVPEPSLNMTCTFNDFDFLEAYKRNKI